ncbi:MAG: hypothetical protein ACREFE_15685 [Limisphaerales bacterium]
MPDKSTTLSAVQIHELGEKIVTLRHDVNNRLSLIAAAAELIKRHPQTSARQLATLLEQPHQIAGIIAQFARDFEAVLKITKP